MIMPIALFVQGVPNYVLIAACALVVIGLIALIARAILREPMAVARLEQCKHGVTCAPLLRVIDRIAALHPLRPPSGLKELIGAASRIALVEEQIARIEDTAHGGQGDRSLLPKLEEERAGLRATIDQALKTFTQEDRSFYLLECFLESRKAEAALRGIPLQELREALRSFYSVVDSELVWQVARRIDPDTPPIDPSLLDKVLESAGGVIVKQELKHLCNAWLWREGAAKCGSKTITIDQYRNIAEELQWLSPELRLIFGEFIGLRPDDVRALKLSDFRRNFDLAAAGLKKNDLGAARPYLEALEALSRDPQRQDRGDYAGKLSTLKAAFSDRYGR
jgi:hypothetical protein